MLSKLSPFAISSLCKLDEEANKLYSSNDYLYEAGDSFTKQLSKN